MNISRRVLDDFSRNQAHLIEKIISRFEKTDQVTDTKTQICHYNPRLSENITGRS